MTLKAPARPKAARAVTSIFDPRRKGTDEDSLLHRHRKDLVEAKRARTPRQRLAENLLRLRSQAKLTQAAVAKRAKLGLATYQRIEQCQPTANPELGTLESLARALGVAFDQLWV